VVHDLVAVRLVGDPRGPCCAVGPEVHGHLHRDVVARSHVDVLELRRVVREPFEPGGVAGLAALDDPVDSGLENGRLA
jgi:hypothetical protein